MATITVPTTPAVRRSADHLLLVGALAGGRSSSPRRSPDAHREGFDITRHPISQLSAGSLGWIQITTFVLAGLGGLALATSIKRTITEGVGRRVLPIFVGIFGVGLIAAGPFTMDAENGFPVGTPDAPVAQMSWHSVVHSTAAAVAFTPGHRSHHADRPLRPPSGRAACRRQRGHRARAAASHVAGPHEHPDRGERPGRLHLDNRRRALAAPVRLTRRTVTQRR